MSAFAPENSPTTPDDAIGRERRLIFIIIINIAVTAGQLIASVISGSLALFSDAMQNLTDVTALIISFTANRLCRRNISPEKTFGYRRAQIVAAFVNSSVLLVVAAYLIIAAIIRLFDPQPIDTGIMMLFGGFAIVVNGISAAMMWKGRNDSMNMKSSFYHVFSDFLTSVAVLIAGALMSIYDIYWLDSVLTLFIGVMLIGLTGKLIYNTVRVLMQFAPQDIDIQDIEEVALGVEGVSNLHDVRLWQLDDVHLELTADVEFDDDPSLSEVEERLKKIESLLRRHFSIEHSTLQPEQETYPHKGLLEDD